MYRTPILKALRAFRSYNIVYIATPVICLKPGKVFAKHRDMRRQRNKRYPTQHHNQYPLNHFLATLYTKLHIRIQNYRIKKLVSKPTTEKQ
jgi:hypothetical protein